MKKIITTLMIALFTTITASAQDKAFTLPKHFTADINYMMPMKFNPRTVSGYTLEMIGDSVSITLPYMGEAYSAVLPGDNNMDFYCKAEKLEFGKTKKGAVTISFEAKKDSQRCKFFITAYDNSTIEVDITPENASMCSYRGNWEAATEDKKKK